MVQSDWERHQGLSLATPQAFVAPPIYTYPTKPRRWSCVSPRIHSGLLGIGSGLFWMTWQEREHTSLCSSFTLVYGLTYDGLVDSSHSHAAHKLYLETLFWDCGASVAEVTPWLEKPWGPGLVLSLLNSLSTMHELSTLLILGFSNS